MGWRIIRSMFSAAELLSKPPGRRIWIGLLREGSSASRTSFRKGFRRKPFRNDVRDAEDPSRSKPIHIRRPGGFERSSAAENIERIIRHPIALKNDVFH